MKYEIREDLLRTKTGNIIKHLILQLIVFWALGTMLHIFTSPNPFDIKLPGWWTSMILLPIGVAIGLTFGTRKFQLVIADPNDLEKTKEWTLQFLSKNGLEIKEKGHNE